MLTAQLVLQLVASLFLVLLLGTGVWGAKKRYGVMGLIGMLVFAAFCVISLAGDFYKALYENLTWWQPGHYDHQLQDFTVALRMLDPEGLWFVRAEASGPAEVAITVSDRWHSEHHQVRLQRAQNLYRSGFITP